MHLNLKTKKHMITISIKLFICICLYSMLMALNLVNRQDALWNGPYYFAYNWELSLGRWLIRFWDAIQFGVHVNPFTTIITLLLFILGTEVLINIFKFSSGSWQDYLISTLFLSNMTVCVSVSYLYTSGIYGLSFLLSMICAKYITCNSSKKRHIIIASICLSLVMGLYQTYLGCILLVILIDLIILICKKYDYHTLQKYLIRSSCTGILGLCMYELFLHLNLSFFGTTISSYKGANNISLTRIITYLIPSIKEAYITFWDYLTGRSYHWSIFSSKILTTIFIIIIIYGISVSILSVLDKKLYILLCILFIVLIPLAANITFILAPKSGFLEQQTAPLALFISIVFVLILKINYKNKAIPKKIIAIVSSFLLLGNIYQILIDQEAMNEGMIASKTIATSVFQTLIENNYYNTGTTYALMGSPYDSPIFHVTPIYNKSNNYANVGGPWWESALDHNSWYGLYHYRLGINLPLCNSEQYNKLLNSELVKNMPLYPAQGSIQEIDGIIVIKIS